MFKALTIAKKTALATVAALSLSSAAQAVTVSGVSAVFDNGDDLLQISGTVTSTIFGSFNEIGFDWDGSLNNYNFSSAELVSSNVGGTLVTPAGGLTRGTFAISGMVGAPFAAGFTFDFLVRLPGANNRFANNDIDIFVCDDCTPFYFGGEVVNGTVTPSAGDLSVPPLVPLPTSIMLLLGGVAGIALWGRRRKPAPAAIPA